MKKIYIGILIPTLQLPKELTVYRMLIGENKRDQSRLRLFGEICKACGFFFEKNTREVDNFVRNLKKHYVITERHIDFKTAFAALKRACPFKCKKPSTGAPIRFNLNF